MAEHEHAHPQEHQPDRSALDELAVLADDLLAEAAAARARWAELGAVLGVDAPETPNGTEAAAPPAAVPLDAPSGPAPLSGPASGPAHAPFTSPAPAPTEPDPDPIRLVALDMMLSGRTREEVDAYIGATFGDGIDPAIVDDVFDVAAAEPDPGDDAAADR